MPPHHEWRADSPPSHGYYLGAWKRHDEWQVSELWFNPDSSGSKWWPTRGYLSEHLYNPFHESIPVQFWRDLPEPPSG